MREAHKKRIPSIIPHVCHVNLGPNNPVHSCSPSVVHENNAIGGTSDGQSKTGAGNPSSGDDDDDTQVNSDLLNIWMQRLQVLTVVVSRRDIL